MLTFFTTAKPFVGHIDIIQRNAIRSWQKLHPDVEILLMGDDAGAEEVFAELGLRHISDVRRDEYGTEDLSVHYDQAQKSARHELLCHINCDIILTGNFLRAVKEVTERDKKFLMGGRRGGVGWT